MGKLIIELSVMPVGEGPNLSQYVAKALRIIEKSGLEYKMNDFGTIISGEWDEVMHLVKQCHYAVLESSTRVLTRIVIDERTDKDYNLGDKIRSVEMQLGYEVKK